MPTATRSGSTQSRSRDVDISECISPVQRSATTATASATIPDFSSFVPHRSSNRVLSAAKWEKEPPPTPSLDVVHYDVDCSLDRKWRPHISVPVGLPMTKHWNEGQRHGLNRGLDQTLDHGLDRGLSRKESTVSPGPLPYFVKRDRSPFACKSPRKMESIPNGISIAVDGAAGFRLDDECRVDAARRRNTLKAEKVAPRRGRKQWSRTPQPKKRKKGRKRKENAAIIPRSKNRGVIQRQSITPMPFGDLKRRRSGGKLEHTLSSPVIGKGPRRSRRRSKRRERAKIAQSARFLDVDVHEEYAVSSDDGDLIYYLQPRAGPPGTR